MSKVGLGRSTPGPPQLTLMNRYLIAVEVTVVVEAPSEDVATDFALMASAHNQRDPDRSSILECKGGALAEVIDQFVTRVRTMEAR